MPTNVALDAMRRVKSFTNGNNKTATNQFNTSGDPIKLPNPLGDNTQGTFDVAHNPLTSKNARSQTSTATLAGDDSRLTALAYSDGTTPNVNMVYDGFGRALYVNINETTHYDYKERLSQSTDSRTSQN